MPDPEEIVEDVIPGEETPETHEGFVSFESRDKDVNVQHKKFRDEERGRVAAEGRLSTVETELEALKAKNAEVVVPPVPDPLSETYAADVQTRDDAITAKAGNEAEQVRLTEDRKKEDEARVAKARKADDKLVATFDANMVAHGLNPTEVKDAVNTIIDYGISESFKDVLLEDPDGALFSMYLKQNPIELEAMNGMSTLQLVNHLNGDIRAKASLLKPQTSDAPDPPIVLDGGGAPESKEDWEEGAKYE